MGELFVLVVLSAESTEGARGFPRPPWDVIRRTVTMVSPGRLVVGLGGHVCPWRILPRQVTRLRFKCFTHRAGVPGLRLGGSKPFLTNANLIPVLICLAVTLVALTRPREPRRPPNLIPPCAPPCPTGTPPARYHDDPRQTPLLGGCAITALAVVAAHPLTQCMLSFVVSAFARLAVTARFSITRSIPTRG